MSGSPPSLTNKAVLLVEDDYFLMSAFKRSLEAQGAQIVGPAPSVDRALELATTAPHLDAAVLDINLQNEMAFPVADVLRERGVPFVFTTGYDEAIVPVQHRGAARFEKPVQLEDVVRTLIELTSQSSTGWV